jgi:hypothetical protein
VPVDRTQQQVDVDERPPLEPGQHIAVRDQIDQECARHRRQLLGVPIGELAQELAQRGRAYTWSNSAAIPPERTTSTSSTLCAPAAIPATIEVCLPAGFAPAEATRAAVIATLPEISSDRPARSASAITGTNPAHDTSPRVLGWCRSCTRGAGAPSRSSTSGLGAPAEAGGPLPITSARMGHLWDALCVAYVALGFDQATEGDEVFRQLVLARIIEPTSKLDSVRVLAEVGVAAASYPTMNRRLRVYSAGSWREVLAATCAKHAGLGPAR